MIKTVKWGRTFFGTPLNGIVSMNWKNARFSWVK